MANKTKEDKLLDSYEKSMDKLGRETSNFDIKK